MTISRMQSGESAQHKEEHDHERSVHHAVAVQANPRTRLSRRSVRRSPVSCCLPQVRQWWSSSTDYRGQELKRELREDVSRAANLPASEQVVYNAFDISAMQCNETL